MEAVGKGRKETPWPGNRLLEELKILLLARNGCMLLLMWLWVNGDKNKK